MQGKTQLPIPKIKKRSCDLTILQKAEEAGLMPIVARVIAGRKLPENISIEDILQPKLKKLTSPFLMADIDKAAARMADAIITGECIGLETDHDCDGQTSHAVFYYCLVEHFYVPKEKVRSYIGHRLLEGYGLSDKVVDRILQDTVQPRLVVTADNGSTDELRIARLKQNNIDVIVTDHHQIPYEGIPKSAYACLNPTRDDCPYPDPYIAGCMVAWLLMSATRQVLIERAYLPEDAPKLLDTLDYVAVGTVADCVSMAKSLNNRVMVMHGLKQIQQGTKPCWRAISNLVRQREISVEDLGFVIGPLLNSDGRLGTALDSVSFLLSRDDVEAEQWVDALQLQNSERKHIQRTITNKGIESAISHGVLDKYTICVYLEDGHPGVHGISASRVKDLFGRPTVFLAPKQNTKDLITGSIRGIEGFHVKEALSWIHQKAPELLVAFGGHSGAGGVTLAKAGLHEFRQYFEQYAKETLSNEAIGPVMYTDGTLKASELNVATYQALQVLNPYGREFEAPVFEAICRVLGLQYVGDGTHAKLRLQYEQKVVSGIWFHARKSKEESLPFGIGDQVQLVFGLNLNQFGGFERVELQINLAQLVKTSVLQAESIV